MTKIFTFLAAVILSAMLAAPAGAVCFDRQKVALCDKLPHEARTECIQEATYPPVAVTDATGTVVLPVDGKQVTVTGLPPKTDVCRNLLFKSAAKKCVGDKMHFDARRDPATCKGVGKGGMCVHIECDEINPAFLKKKKQRPRHT